MRIWEDSPPPDQVDDSSAADPSSLPDDLFQRSGLSRSRSRSRGAREDAQVDTSSYSLLRLSAARRTTCDDVDSWTPEDVDYAADGSVAPVERTHVTDRWCSEYPMASDPSAPCPIELGASFYRPGWQELVMRNGSSDEVAAVKELRDSLCSLGHWSPSCFSNSWTSIPEAHPYVLLIDSLQPCCAPVGAFHVFVDGSFYPSTGVGSWAFVVVLKSGKNDFRRWGYTGAVIDGESSSLHAEALGALAALHWIATALADQVRPVTHYCDATCIGLGISGQQRMPCIAGLNAGKCRSYYQFVKALIPSLQYHHVKAHDGQIDNELIDSVAKALASQSWSV